MLPSISFLFYYHLICVYQISWHAGRVSLIGNYKWFLDFNTTYPQILSLIEMVCILLTHHGSHEILDSLSFPFAIICMCIN